AFLLYMETRPDMNTTPGPYQPFTNHFFGIAQKWQKVKEETPTKLDLSLRSTLLLAYMTEFQERLRHALEPNNKETSESILDTSKPPVTHSKVLDAVARSLTLLGNSNLIHRFRATRPLALEYEANILTFLMLVSNRPTPVYLRNPHNVCYLNASLTGLLWAGLFNWASLLQGWRNLTQQHDAAEFSDFLLGRLLPPAFQGHYQCALATAGEPAALLLSNDGT
ncbi:unnamed protein product, partial [Symbiodinium sp. KB8]